MFGFKTRKRLQKEIVSMRREYDRLNKLLIRRTTALQEQERKASEVADDVDKLLAMGNEQYGEIKKLAGIIIQASRGQNLDEFCTTADSLCERFPDLAPQPEGPDPKEGG